MTDDDRKAMTLRLNSIQRIALGIIAQVEEKSVNDVVCEAIDEYLAKRKADPAFQEKLRRYMDDQTAVVKMMVTPPGNDRGKG